MVPCRTDDAPDGTVRPVSSNPPMDLLATMLAALGADRRVDVRVAGESSLPSVFAVTDLAVASMAAAAVCLAELPGGEHRTGRPITVDRDLASRWFQASLVPEGWTPPPAWDAVAGDYEAADGWIRLHTNAPHHRAAALDVLGAPGDPGGAARPDVARAVRRWSATALEAAIVGAGGAAAAMRSVAEWSEHEQGRSVAAEPLVAHRPSEPETDRTELVGTGRGRPLAGVRVLDLTRVLAGPVGTRLLAGWGATVLRIDPPGWDEPAVAPEMMLGKRSARLDLTVDADRARFVDLLAAADVLVHGYRADALDRLGFGDPVRDRIRPGLVDVALDAYGWTGPWRTRRGFDSLVQMSSGIADEGRRVLGRDRPTPLPVQALDHATGYLMAAAALRGLSRRAGDGRGSRWRLSLAATSRLLVDAARPDPQAPPVAGEPALDDSIETTSWGPARRLVAPLSVPGAALRWDRPARAIGSDPARWW
jgi:crotonobetainyl-CoA:carnitine CoA-transferase CaiB-like acyl-CoA transferase